MYTFLDNMINIRKHIKIIKDNSERRNTERGNKRMSKYIINEEIKRELNIKRDFSSWNWYRQLVELGYLQFNYKKESWEFCKNVEKPYIF